MYLFKPRDRLGGQDQKKMLAPPIGCEFAMRRCSMASSMLLGWCVVAPLSCESSSKMVGASVCDVTGMGGGWPGRFAGQMWVPGVLRNRSCRCILIFPLFCYESFCFHVFVPLTRARPSIHVRSSVPLIFTFSDFPDLSSIS